VQNLLRLGVELHGEHAHSRSETRPILQFYVAFVAVAVVEDVSERLFNKI
jgi:hypothetical protein